MVSLSNHGFGLMELQPVATVVHIGPSFDKLRISGFTTTPCLPNHVLIWAARKRVWPTGRYPVLEVDGEHGCAKSTGCRVIRSLIDPNRADLRTGPREERDLIISAKNSWMLGFDNLSSIPAWLSDALCRLSTGGGYAARELYSDTDEVIIDVQRPVICNGINELAQRSDLLDRTLRITMPVIREDQRRTEREFWSAFEQATPAILGGIFVAVSAALRNLP